MRWRDLLTANCTWRVSVKINHSTRFDAPLKLYSQLHTQDRTKMRLSHIPMPVYEECGVLDLLILVREESC